MLIEKVRHLLGDEAEYLLHHQPKISKEKLHLPGEDFVDRIFTDTDRSVTVKRNLQTLFNAGRLSGTGYLSILPVDQGLEHTAGSAFAPNPEYFDPENIVTLAIDAECSAVASSLGVLGSVARKYAHKIPFVVKINHNEVITYPNHNEQHLFGQVDQAFNMGALGIGATIYFGSPDTNREIEEISKAFKKAHELGMFCILWCYVRNRAFKTISGDYTNAVDLSSQAIHIGATIQADIVKQKLPEFKKGFESLQFGKPSEQAYQELLSDHPIDMVRYQVLNAYAGRVGLINSGGASGKNDFEEAAKTAVINKRAGGMGLIMGRKAFQRPRKEGIELLQLVQDIYKSSEISVA